MRGVVYLSQPFLGPVGSKESDGDVDEEYCSPPENRCSYQEPTESIAYDRSRVDGNLVHAYSLTETLASERVCDDGHAVDEEKSGSYPLDETEEEKSLSCWGKGAE
ncbi:MAG: hypothetical protein AUJ07_02935 [Crenarchaeota archaeon 13_1_40CM_3_53_5]|nr:MAG: hypothetical protein AUJ07_02935 [Crenarchaeota archaeon 13_1_40CM_3_53_5]